MPVGKDPGKRHFYLSLAKSALRIGACAFAAILATDTALAMAVLAWGLLSAEVVGILEEL